MNKNSFIAILNDLETLKGTPLPVKRIREELLEKVIFIFSLIIKENSSIVEKYLDE